MKKKVACLLAIMGLIVSCERQKYESVDVAEFEERIKGPDVILLDVRSPEEYAEEHISDAINIDQNQADFVHIAQLKLSTLMTIAVYCRSGRRSENAAARLADVGYNVVNLKGGIMAWKAASRAVTTEETDNENKVEEVEEIEVLHEANAIAPKQEDRKPSKEEKTHAESHRVASSMKLKVIKPVKTESLLESMKFDKGFCVVADNSFYYVKVISSSNCYFIAPVARKPSENDELMVTKDGPSYIIKHTIPDAETAKEQTIGSLSFEGDDIVTFAKDFSGRVISSTFKTT